MNFSDILRFKTSGPALITLCFLLLALFQSPPLAGIERIVFHWGASLSERPASDNHIALVRLDKGDNQLTATITQLSAAGAGWIGLAVPADKLTDEGEGLATAIEHAGNVVLGAEPGMDPDSARLPTHLYAGHISLPLPPEARLRLPPPSFTGNAAAVGFLNPAGDAAEDPTRGMPLAAIDHGHAVPAMPLALAALDRHLPIEDIRIHPGDHIELGAADIPVDASLNFLPIPGATQFETIQPDKVTEASLRDKIILVGSPALLDYNARILDALLHNAGFTLFSWNHSLTLLLMIAVGLYLILLATRLAPMQAAAATTAILLLLIGGKLFALVSLHLDIATAAAALLLLTGQLAIAVQRIVTSRPAAEQDLGDPNETNRMLGLSFQSQGMLDRALEKFLACPPDDDLLPTLYDLALAFERKRQFDQAIAVYQHMVQFDPAYRDIQTRLVSARGTQQMLADGKKSDELASLLASGGTRPTLGRYEVVSELGKGAMGTVYLGRDPKINRDVAIKTMALSKEFEASELEDVKARFFHEAEIAGMLNHPNIVTIFDAGDEHDLAYIAMEYLNGVDLVPYTRQAGMLPLTTTLRIIAKVAEALQYAHENGVIHRDIKPANIMILKNRAVKVTDFGIAHINDSSKTKAGSVLGTPSYMSPEQLSGKTLDGRSDIFSLGVMLYEMVTGTRPFRAESISKLMLKIAKEPHVDPRERNPELPDRVAELINHMLAKKADQRIGSAGEVLEELQLCIKELKNHNGDGEQ